jgi:hypothetical protein
MKYLPIMNIENYASMLRSTKHDPYEEGFYTSNTTGLSGYWAKYCDGSSWYWYSVSNTTRVFTPVEVAEAISKGAVTRQGPYKADGFEATVRLDGHSYMLGAGSSKP